MKKICIVTCYKQPDYVRAITLRKSLDQNVYDVIIVKNTKTNFLRYAEVIVKTFFVRLKYRPDIFLITFRGYEILPFIRVISLGKKLIFDEFINLIEWIDYEHHKINTNKYPGKLLFYLYRAMLNSTDLILTDTESHAALSSEIMSINIKKYKSIVVSTDEKTFRKVDASKVHKKTMQVFYYGSMLPLHGLNYVVDAMLLLRDKPIKLTLIGGNNSTEELINKAIKKGANIEYKKWVDFNRLPNYIAASDLCLAGPFGDTFQSQYVITGKAYQFLSMGKPVVIGKNLETKIFKNKYDALIVNQASAEEISKVILWAYNNSAEIIKIGDRGNNLYKKVFSNHVIAEEMKSVINDL